MSGHIRKIEYYDNATSIPIKNDDVFTVNIPPGIKDAPTLFDVLYEKLELPGYFGFNWNALSDCLRDFHWIKEKDIALVHTDIPITANENDTEIYIEILQESMNDWKDGEEHSLRVFFPLKHKEFISKIAHR